MSLAHALPRRGWIAGLVLSSVLLQPSSLAEPPNVSRVTILERGIYDARAGRNAVARGSLGPVRRIEEARLIESTTHIPGRRSLRFGVRYRVDGKPLGALLELQMVTIFPNGRPASKATRSSFTVLTMLGNVAYREFMFDDDEEIILGEWVFEFWHGLFKVGEQRFCVHSPEEENIAASKNCPRVPTSIRNPNLRSHESDLTAALKFVSPDDSES